MSRIHRYEGKAVAVLFDTGRCIHAADCVRGLPSVFDPKRTPWVDPDAASEAQIREVVARCPSGALKTVAIEPEAPDPMNSVSLVPNGPLYFRGRAKVVNASGDTVVEDFRMALCRCGESRAKPFCDNRHRALPFQHDGSVANAENLEAVDFGESEICFEPVTDGPLHVMGPLRILDASGQVRFSGMETWLCRCGASASKPFCDGSHKACGFKSD